MTTLTVFNGENSTATTGEKTIADDGLSLLNSYITEVKARHSGRLHSKVKPKEYEAGKAVLDSRPKQQLFVAVAGAELLVKESFLDPQRDAAIRELLRAIFRKELPYDSKSVKKLFTVLKTDALATSVLPVAGILTNIEKYVRRNGLSSDVSKGCQRLSKYYHPNATSSEARKHGSRVETILAAESEVAKTDSLDIQTGEAWTDAFLVELEKLSDEQRSAWYSLLEHCATASQSKPSKRWLKQANELITPLGDGFANVLQPVFAAVGEPGKCQKNNHGSYMFFTHPTQIHDTHADMLRGLVWATSLVTNAELISQVGDTAEKCFQKVPEVGPRSPKIGNACLIALSSITEVLAVAQLGRLKSRAKHASTRKQIARALDRAAENAGLSPADLEEIAVPTFGLETVGQYDEQLGEFTATITVGSSGKPTLLWAKSDGKVQKTIPAAVKSDHPDDLKVLKKKVKDISTLLPSIRFRAEQLFSTTRSWAFNDFQSRWLDHPIVGVFARRLIWKMESKAGVVEVIWKDGHLVDIDNRRWDGDPSAVTVSIWHPIEATAETVLQWREWLEANEVRQPLKQAHREVYVLTDAERETSVYSNRFAAHIIRQHQFQALCHQRGWRYQLQGEWDSHNVPYIELPQHDLCAEFHVAPIEGSNEVTPSFIYVYLSTDQVRFRKLENGEPVPLDEVPQTAFSEVMRDVDLFVGVTSVGNDPNWSPGSDEDYSEYCEAFSFGELSQTAETRKDVLQRVIPRLTIADKCKLDGRFLVVQGKLRSYKIHLGSSNILMSPNDQYLCIVKKRDGGTKQTDSIYLPFEGDSTLAMILSKAFLLADDHKIKDATITNQIAGN